MPPILIALLMLLLVIVGLVIGSNFGWKALKLFIEEANKIIFSNHK